MWLSEFAPRFCCDVAADGGVCTCIPAKYERWIAQYKAEHSVLLGMCNHASKQMKEAFPELEIVRGHVLCPPPLGRRGHVWLIDPDGRIVDPTAAQFPAIYEYEPWQPGDEVRCGKCMNCGVDIWKAVYTLDVDHTASVCSDECEDELRRELDREFEEYSR